MCRKRGMWNLGIFDIIKQVMFKKKKLKNLMEWGQAKNAYKPLLILQLPTTPWQIVISLLLIDPNFNLKLLHASLENQMVERLLPTCLQNIQRSIIQSIRVRIRKILTIVCLFKMMEIKHLVPSDQSKSMKNIKCILEHQYLRKREHAMDQKLRKIWESHHQHSKITLR